MANTILKSFKPKPSYQPNFWYTLGIEDEDTSKNTAIHQGFKPIVYRNIVEKAKLSQNEFHNVTLIPISTIKRRLKNQERFSTQESDVMYRLAMLIKLATDLFGNEQRALEWVRESVYGLNGKRPLDMIATTVDFETIKDLIGRVEHGVFS
ncbi:type II RES/Xre toxin-antitoxin system antitoxin [Vibrio misgurnus]|uniref:type II RES/Xre toxin-antitoxin system antitoxin n=1 Tax=Vibrio misgurnus TaxID=2993714 RepID=UPI0024175DFB|nr:antitoxin Xre/MbcA/ParS toxin-binding domain-containing protein [Vibrio sp. gvc]